MKSLAVLFMLLFSHLLTVYGQADSVFHLKEITITNYRLQSIAKTGRVKSLDTSQVNRINASTLTEVLSQSSAVFLKDNGGGRLATMSIHGTVASQNALTWNGLSLNTPTLGLSDLSLMPAFFIDKISLQYGGNGSLNGSAVIGGAVHLSSAPEFNTGWKGQLFSGNASFSDYQQGVSVSYASKKYYMRTALFHRSAKNNYHFTDIYILNKPEREQVHAAIDQKGLLQEHFLLLKNNLLSLQYMLLDAGREIPPLMGSLLYQSDQFEKDKQLRLVAAWKHDAGKLQTMARLGWLDDRINYSDGFIHLDDKSRGQNMQAEGEAIYIMGSHQLQGGFLLNSSRAYVNSFLGSDVQGYPGYHFLERSSFYLSYRYTFRKTLLTTISLRRELEKEKDYPFLPAAGLQLRVCKELFFYANAAAVYRTPTLNDFYWQPGGNPLLKPEKGYQSDMRLQNHSNIYNFSMDADAGIFYMKINNWIQWMPDNDNNYSPVNIETVVSRGTEFSGNITYRCRKWKSVSGGEMEYIIATNTNGFGIASIAGKQLVYTPKIKWKLTQAVTYRKTSLKFQYDYTGHRFTTADNSSWLTPYGIALLSLSQELASRYGNIYITAGVNNLFDKKYEVIGLRPMPGRWYRISILLTVHDEKKSTKPVGE